MYIYICICTYIYIYIYIYRERERDMYKYISKVKLPNVAYGSEPSARVLGVLDRPGALVEAPRASQDRLSMSRHRLWERVGETSSELRSILDAQRSILAGRRTQHDRSWPEFGRSWTKLDRFLVDFWCPATLKIELPCRRELDFHSSRAGESLIFKFWQCWL